MGMAAKFREKMKPRVQPQLAPGEQVQAAFMAQTFSGWWIAVSTLIVIFAKGYRVVVVTDRRILVFDRGKGKNMGAIRRELPRATKIGPHKGIWYKTNALGEKLYIAKG